MKSSINFNLLKVSIALICSTNVYAITTIQDPILNTQSNQTSASASNYKPSQTILERNTTYQINADSTLDIQSDIKLKINDQQGVEYGSQIPLQFNPDYETLDIVEAYTQKPDGRKIPVTPDKLITSQATSSSYAPIFNQNKVKTVIFADTSIGDVLVLKQKIHRKPILDNQVNIMEVIDPSAEIVRANYVISAPKSMHLQLQNQGLVVNHSSNKDTETWHLILDKHTAKLSEPKSAYTIETLPHIFASNLKGYNDVAKSYYDNHIEKAEVTPGIQKQADAITQGISPSNKLGQAQAIYNWVSGNIRYVAVYLGNGSLVPHKASDVLVNRYGDCKDHVVLLEALLAAKGIKSVPVLVGIGNSLYDVPKVATMPGTFDHVINYLPEFDKYIDSTIGLAPFGTLADMENGKPALITHNAQGQGELVTLPLQTQDNRSEEEIEIEILADGSAKGSNVTQYRGSLDILSRQKLKGVQPSMGSQIMKNYLQESNQIGQGNLSFTNPHDLTKPFTTTTQYQLTDVYDNKESLAFVLPLGTGASLDIHPDLLNYWTTTSSRNAAMIAPNAIFNSTWHYKLPNNIKITRVPKNINFSNEVADYTVQYQRGKNDITVDRSLAFKWKKPFIPASKYGAFQELNDQIHRDFKRPVVYNLVKVNH